MKKIIGCNIKFITNGEKINDFDVFHPDRAASMILGQGDVVSLVEKAADVISAQEAKETMEKVNKNTLTLDDFLMQIGKLKKMGGISTILSMIPGLGGHMNASKNAMSMMNDDSFKQYKYVINSMTKREKKSPKIIDKSRKIRIANGSGTSVTIVNNLLKHFASIQSMMKNFSSNKQMLGSIMKGNIG